MDFYFLYLPSSPFFFKVRILFLLTPRGSVGEGQGSEGGTLSFELNLVPLNLTSHHHLLFCLKPTSIPEFHEREQDPGIVSFCEHSPCFF